MVALAKELRGMRDRLWNSEWFIVFMMVILQQARNITSSQEICRRIEKRLDAWEAGFHGMLVEETLHTCRQYFTTSCREDSEYHRDKTYHSLVL